MVFVFPVYQNELIANSAFGPMLVLGAGVEGNGLLKFGGFPGRVLGGFFLGPKIQTTC
jgi:hypothetical protein